MKLCLAHLICIKTKVQKQHITNGYVLDYFLAKHSNFLEFHHHHEVARQPAGECWILLLSDRSRSKCRSHRVAEANGTGTNEEMGETFYSQEQHETFLNQLTKYEKWLAIQESGT